VMDMFICGRKRRFVNLESCSYSCAIIMNDIYLFVMLSRFYLVISAKRSLSVL